MFYNIKNKLNKIPKPVKATFFYTIIVFLQSAVSLLTTPIFTRILSTEDYGITNLYNSWYNLFSILITLNLSYGVYNNALLEFKDERNKVTSSFLSISVMLSLISLLVFTLFRNNIASLLNISSYLIYFMIINCLTVPAWNFYINKEKFNYNYLKPFILSCVLFISNPLLGILGIKLFPNNRAEAKVIFSGLLNILFSTYLLIIAYKKGKCFYDKKLWRYALRFNIPLIPHYLSNVLLASSDRIMIAKLIDESKAGIYSVSYNISNVVSGVLSGINSAWVPFTYKALEKKDYNKIKNNTKYLVVFVAIITFGVVLIAPEAIKILATDEYYSARWVIPPVILGIFFNFVASLFANIEFYHKRSYFVTIATAIAGVSNIILNLILIPKFGFIIAGYTTLIGYVILTVTHYLFMKKIESNKIYDVKVILLITIILSTLIFIITILYDYIFIRYLLVCVLIILLFFNLQKIINFVKELKK